MKITNKKAYFDFEVREKFEAGINLLGSEVKAIRLGHADLSGSFVKIVGAEAYLINSKIFPYEFGRPENYDPGRTRKLLMHKKEIISIKSKIEGADLTIVPVSWYTSNRLIKLEIALGKSKKKFEKRQAIKKKDLDREQEELLKNS
ncbi:MAG TPA: SsrA-binding protein SmpB [Xanthomonadales bacterium]|nr:SsrA-binding protein SmpB [Xanthomonadales bacterium]